MPIEIGLEKEYFVLDRKTKQLLEPSKHGFPIDECGYLAEARGEHFNDDIAVVFSLLAEEHRLKQQAKRAKVILKEIPYLKVKPEIAREFLKKYGKNPSETRNIYGKHYPLSPTMLRAGLHVHFSNKLCHTTVSGDNTEKKFYYYSPIDIPTIIKHLDFVFQHEIKETKRIQGEYEMKEYGFEYRSLPNNIDLFTVAKESRDILSKVF